MVGAASLPVWAALIVEAARLLRDGGWWSRSPVVEHGPVAPCECPDCSLVLSCSDVSVGTVAWWLLLAALVGGLIGGCISRQLYGGKSTRATPSRRGGGVVQ